MSRKLVIDDGTRQRELQLVDRLVVGRDPSCDISADHSLLSRRHAEFVAAGNAVTVRDLGSRNGLFVNGSRAAERTLSPGDVVQIGPLRARYVHDDAPLSITPEVLDGDRTAMLHSPLPAAFAKAPATPAPVAVPTPSQAVVLEDTVVPGAPVDEDVTRMVPAPRTPDRPSASEGDSDEEVTRFTQAPGPPIEVKAILRPAPVSMTPPEPTVITSPAPAAEVPIARTVEAVRAPVAQPARAADTPDPGLSSFVLTGALAIGGITALGSFAAAAIVPGIGALVGGMVVGGAVAFGVAGAINRRVDAAVGRTSERS